MKLPISD